MKFFTVGATLAVLMATAEARRRKPRAVRAVCKSNVGYEVNPDEPSGAFILYQSLVKDPEAPLGDTKVVSKWSGVAADTDFTVSLVDDDVADCQGSALLSLSGVSSDSEGMIYARSLESEIDIQRDESVVGSYLQLSDASGAEVVCCQIRQRTRETDGEPRRLDSITQN